ncbi:kinase suppressor of Ras 1 [Chrysoperla carnea]|uniref:kinase suppressor of Ras 1 n=1 Tax=Chrysoperla carnea TaxID=189513 RepID=UPI001D06E50F|nr:kinase suppressor of Ras 1 [Chrysoperla carnea]
METNDEVAKVREELKVVQPMIDISADRLNGLRTQCATSVDLTRQEIRTLEGKLLKMFARQLVTKSKLRGDSLLVFRDTPSVRQWLQVVGLRKESIDGICERIDSLESLQERSDHDLNNILRDRKASPDELRRLHRALYNLKRYTDILQRGDNNIEEPSDLELYWDSWDQHHRHKPMSNSSPHVSRNRAIVDQQQNAMTIPSDDVISSYPSTLSYNNFNNNHEYHSSDDSFSSFNSCLHSPPVTPPVIVKKASTINEKHKFPSTPPPHKKHQTIGQSAALLPVSFPLTKSKSHESQLSAKAPENKDVPCLDLISTRISRSGRLPTESGLSSNIELASNTPSNISSITTSPAGVSPVGVHSSPARSPISQMTSPDIASPSPSPAHLSTASSSIPPNSPLSIISPCSPNALTPTHNKTPSPSTPGPTIVPSFVTYVPNSTTNSNITQDSSPVIVSPVNLSPIPGSPLSPITRRSMTAKNHLMGSPHTPRSKCPDSSPLALHNVHHTNISPVSISPIKSPALSNLECEEFNTLHEHFRLIGNISSQKSPHKSGGGGGICNISSGTALQNAGGDNTGASKSMRHTIAHRFTKMYKMMATCDYCDRQMLFVTGLKCRECKFKCHRECAHKVPASCGLPSELVNEFKRHISPAAPQNHSPNPGPTPMSSPNHYHNNILSSVRDRKKSHPQPSMNPPPFIGQDSSSNTSSCNSSTPSSPALLSVHTPVNKMHFHFPDVDREIVLVTHPLEELAETQTSNDSDKTVSACGSGGSGSTDSEQTPVRVDSQESQVSDNELVSENARNLQRWPRQNSQLSMREWDIPFDELKMGERIGVGRFGTVFRGNWHGDVAIKILNMDYLDDDKALEAFKSEVGTFRKTRHENLVLFMGACMKPPRLAIVTSLSKGMTLYTHIHLRKDKFNMNKTTIVAQQITQGMGYLHARGIVHKDLKSKNIFLENGKVVITDFGLFSVTKLCHGNGKANSLNIPPGWLCYLAPEIVRSLRVNQVHHELPFTKASDIYAFGTVWYELLCGDWPFKGQPPESVIWQVGKGMKQPLANLQASRDVKDILMVCWEFRPDERPDFGHLFNLLEKLPKKRLARSPSHPVHLSRSAESVF